MACSESGLGSSSKPAKDAPKPVASSTREPAKDADAVTTKPALDASTTTTSAALPEIPADAPMIGALFLQTPIMSDMEWPPKDDDAKAKKERSAKRIGDLRQSAKVPVIAQAHVKANCKEGWYELVQDGFVCAKYASLDLNHPRMRLGPHAPNLAGPLPYDYGYNIQNGTPLYRTVPSREERLKLEPWLSGAPKKAKATPRENETASYGDDLDAGAPLQLAKATTGVNATTTDPFGLGENGEAPSLPWYLRAFDGGKPQVTLADLKGEGPVARRMVKGFFVALDKATRDGGQRWWRTTGNLLAPYERIYPHKSASEHKGIWLNDDAPATSATDGGAPANNRLPTPDLCKPGSKAQVGVVINYKATRYEISPSEKAAVAGDGISRHSVVRLTDETVSITGATYEQTAEGFWLRGSEMTKTTPGVPPNDLAPNEKWLDVTVTTQTLVAYEGDKPVYATIVSTGKESSDKEKDHRTPIGTFRIREKHIAATMDGDVASDGPYSLEDVPWIMYFQGSYAHRRVLTQQLQADAEPRLRDPRAEGRARDSRLDRAENARGMARRLVDAEAPRHARRRPRVTRTREGCSASLAGRRGTRTSAVGALETEVGDALRLVGLHVSREGVVLVVTRSPGACAAGAA